MPSNNLPSNYGYWSTSVVLFFFALRAFRSRSSGDIYLLEYVAYFVICTCNAHTYQANTATHGHWEHGKIDRSGCGPIDYNRDADEYPIELTINFYLYSAYVSVHSSDDRDCIHNGAARLSIFIKYDWHRTGQASRRRESAMHMEPNIAQRRIYSCAANKLDMTYSVTWNIIDTTHKLLLFSVFIGR